MYLESSATSSHKLKADLQRSQSSEPLALYDQYDAEEGQETKGKKNGRYQIY